MFHYVSYLPVFNKEIALKNVHILMVFTDSFIGPLHKIQNPRIQSCIYVKSIYSYSSHTAFSQGLGDNSFSQVEKCVTKITERQRPQLQIASAAHGYMYTYKHIYIYIYIYVLYIYIIHIYYMYIYYTYELYIIQIRLFPTGEMRGLLQLKVCSFPHQVTSSHSTLPH